MSVPVATLPTPNERAAVVIPLRLTGGRTVEVALDRPCSSCRGIGMHRVEREVVRDLPHSTEVRAVEAWEDCESCQADGYVLTPIGRQVVEWVRSLDGKRFGRAVG